MVARVHISRAAKNEILAWARQAEAREIGGLLLGRVRKTDSGMLVRVEAALRMREAGAVSTSFLLTPESVKNLGAEAQAKYPAFQVVGWFHTHAGLGVFLSNHDLAVHKASFPEPWQMALVLDTKLGQEAIYVWTDGELVQVNPAEMAAAVRDSAATGALVSSRVRYRLKSPWRFSLAIVLSLLLVTALVTGAVRWIRKGVSEQLYPATSLEGVEGSREPTVGREAPPAEGPGDAASGPVASPAFPQGAAAGQRYIIRPGDTLWGISKRFYGVGELYPDLSDFNGLNNPRLVYPGQELVLPENLGGKALFALPNL
jgi:proteasome lid subunit RPN8/RPN11/LysM repeat protein